MKIHVLVKRACIFTLLVVPGPGVLADQPGSPLVDDFLDPLTENSAGTRYTPVSAKGSLARPPEINHSCLPNLEDSFQRIWTLTRFLYQATERGFDNYPAAVDWNGRLSPYKRTLEIELRNERGSFTTACAFDDPILDNATDKWWHCTSTESDALPPFPVETYVQLNRTTGYLAVNQTWYCNDSSTDPEPRYRVTAKGSLPDGPSRRLVCGSSTAVARHVICNTMIAPIWCDVLYAAEWCSLDGDREGRGAPIDFWALEVEVESLEEG